MDFNNFVDGDFAALLASANGAEIKSVMFTDTGSPDDYFEEGYINIPTTDYATDTQLQGIEAGFVTQGLQITYGPVFTPGPPPTTPTIQVIDQNTGSVVTDTAWITGDVPPLMPHLVASLVNPPIGGGASWSFEVSYYAPGETGEERLVQVPTDGTAVKLEDTATWDIYQLYQTLGFFGGAATLKCVVTTPYNPDETVVKTFSILGHNPSRKALQQALQDPALAAGSQVAAPPYYFTALAQVESKQRQFIETGPQAGYPVTRANLTDLGGGYFGDPPDQDFRPQGGFQGPTHFGMFGVTGSESLPDGVSNGVLWNWQENAAAAILTLDDKRALANHFLRKQRARAAGVRIPDIAFPRDDFNPANGTVKPVSDLILDGGDHANGGVPAAAKTIFSDHDVSPPDAGSEASMLEAETIKLYDSVPEYGGAFCTYIKVMQIGWQFNRQRSIDNVSFLDEVAAALP